MVKRRPDQEREETTAREQAEARRDSLLAELKAREAASRAPEPAEAAPADPAPDAAADDTESADEEAPAATPE